MFCSNCGSQLPDDARFCGGCGQPVVPFSSPDASVPATPTTPASASPNTSVQTISNAPTPTSAYAPTPARKSNRNLIVGIICVVAVIIVAVIVGVTQFGSQQNNANGTTATSSSANQSNTLEEEQRKAQEEADRKAKEAEEAARKAKEEQEAKANGFLGSWTIVWGTNYHTITFNADGTGTDTYKMVQRPFTWTRSEVTNGTVSITKTGDNSDTPYVYDINTGVLTREGEPYDRS